ncbi:MAG: septum site-determining protein MinC [Anaerolineae bacterium]|nr:septum site-determining protein MinC [Anaerolineae bacterium]
MAEAISIKGIKQGVLVNLDDDLSWDALLKELDGYVAQRDAFFRGAQWVVDVGERSMDADAVAQLMAQLQARQITLLALLSSTESTRSAAQSHQLFTELAAIPSTRPTQVPEPPDDPEPLPELDSEEHGTAGVLIKRTLRNGRRVRTTGHVVVIGDVNSGAEIVAGGDVIIWGKCRGVVHAGAQGDESAVVCALDLSPTQLRIAGLITVPPQEESKRRVARPEMARVQDGQIEAIPWS